MFCAEFTNSEGFRVVFVSYVCELNSTLSMQQIQCRLFGEVVVAKLLRGSACCFRLSKVKKYTRVQTHEIYTSYLILSNTNRC